MLNIKDFQSCINRRLIKDAEASCICRRQITYII